MNIKSTSTIKGKQDKLIVFALKDKKDKIKIYSENAIAKDFNKTLSSSNLLKNEGDNISLYNTNDISTSYLFVLGTSNGDVCDLEKIRQNSSKVFALIKDV